MFPHLSVLQNLQLGAWHERAKIARDESLQMVYQMFPKLETRAGQLAYTMSGDLIDNDAVRRVFLGDRV